MLMEGKPVETPARPACSKISVSPLAKVTQILKLEVISAIGVPALQRLAEAEAPETVFPAIRGLKPTQNREVLSALKTLDPDRAFFVGMAQIASLLSEEGLDLLREAGVHIQSNLNQGDAITDAYLTASDGFHRARAKRISSESFLDHPHSFFKLSNGFEAAAIRGMTPALLVEAKERCKLHFVNKGYGPTFTLDLYENEGQVGFIITRGGTRRGSAVIDPKENHAHRLDRIVRTDILYVDKGTRVGWVSALAGDKTFYATLLAYIFFESVGAFGQPMAFDLDFAIAENLKTLLSSAGGPDVSRVRMNYRIVDTDEGKLTQSGGRNGCVSERYGVTPNMRNSGRTTATKLTVDMSGPEKISGSIEIKGSCLSVAPHLPEQIARRILSGLSIHTFHDN